MFLISPVFRFLSRHRWKSIFGAIALLIVGGIAYGASRPTVPEYVTAVAERGDLTQTVEAVGTVVSERDLRLQFPMSGIVSQVFVKEGDRVRAGQRLAAIRSGNLSADIAGASARVQSAQAALRALQEGNRPEDIAISEADVQNKMASLQAARSSLETAERQLEQSDLKLEALKREEDIGVSGQISTVGSAVRVQLTAGQDGLATVENVLGKLDVQDAMLKDAPEKYDGIIRAKRQAESAVSAQLAGPTSFADLEAALLALDRGKGVLNQALTVVSTAHAAISALPETSSLQQADKESYKASLATERAAIQSAISALDGQVRSLRDAVAGVSTRIAAEESARQTTQGTRDRAQADINTYETGLKIAQAQLALKKAGARKTDIDAAYARLRQEQASLARASADYSNTVLTAPIAGTVTKVDVKLGEITPAGAAMTLLGDSAFRVEMFVSEIDVPKVTLTQSGSIELDAYRDTHMKLCVSQIDTAPTDREGVSKYRVKLDFVHPHNELKIGMTGDATIITGLRKDVVSVPQRAVIEDAGSGTIVRILKADGVMESRPVSTGMEGEGGNVEVTGVEEGDTVIVLIKE